MKVVTTLVMPLVLLPEATPRQETRQETWPDGRLRAEYSVVRDEAGAEVRHGRFRSFHADGTLESEGAFARGEEDGPWVTFHPNGARAAAGSYAGGLRSGKWETFFPDGKPESQGSWLRGVRSGRWSFWRPDGSKDLAASGIYEFRVHRSREDGRHYRGYLVDNRREGAWSSLWPDGKPQFEGAFTAGARTGPWIFTHPDGTPSTLILTGLYEGGRYAGALPQPEPPPFDRHLFPPVQPAPAGWPEDREGLAARIRAALARRPLEEGLRARLGELGVAAIPVALEVLAAEDPESAEGRGRIGILADLVLQPLCSGHALARHGIGGPPDAGAARELVRAWLSLWALTRSDALFWQESVRGPSRGVGLRDLLQDPPLIELDPRFEPSAAPRPGETVPAAGEPRPEYARRFGREKSALLRAAWPGTKEAIARALAWLAAHQNEDGRWSNGGFTGRCGRLAKGVCDRPGSVIHDVGATGLALLAFLGDGHTASAGDHAEVVARGLAWLAKAQDAEGLVGAKQAHNFLYGHAIATEALCEAVGLGAEGLREPAERALRYLLAARNPDAAWRYDVPPSGDSDTSVTGWAVNALVAARRAGLAVDPAALEGALAWVDKVTDPDSGLVGYTAPFELSARTPGNEEGFPREKGEAMTAVGLWIRLQVGQRPAAGSVLAKHAARIAACPPVVDPQGNDQYYWYYATYALQRLGGATWESWKAALAASVLDVQVTRGDAAGSWNPDGPWGYEMGRVCSTALMTLLLECPVRGEGPSEKER